MLQSYKKQYLIELIEDKKREMLQFAKEHGINSEETLKCSQELDELILDYQKREKKVGKRF